MLSVNIMAITYTTLVGAKTTDGSIRQWVNDSTIPAESILTEAEAWIYERLRVREMIAVASPFTFAVDTASAALPSDFLDPIQLLPFGWGGAELLYVHERLLNASRDDDGNLFSGTPSRWTIIGTDAHVDCLCDSDFSGALMYYACPAALSADNATNFLTLRYPTLLRTVCTAFAFSFKKDDARKQIELALAEKALGDAMRTNDLYRNGQIAS